MCETAKRFVALRHVVGMGQTLTLCGLLLACLDDTPRDGLTCEQQVCSYAPACSALTTGEWDWRSETACLATFDCGPEPGRCLDAVLELPCLSTPPTEEEVLANTRALKLVRERCGALE